MLARTTPLIWGLIVSLNLPVAFSSGAFEKDDAGRQLYLDNCAPCHGVDGRGNGAGARVLPVKPADHANRSVMSARSDQELYDAIAKGGRGIGRSVYMPAWEGQLTPSQIRSLVLYIRSLSAAPK